MINRTLRALACIHADLGLIDISEFQERIEVARWLVDDALADEDPRQPLASVAPEAVNQPCDPAVADSPSTTQNSNHSAAPDWIELVVLRQWFFTRSDPDPYPSTPHGHLQSANRPWPKLNPYTGRAYIAKHQEDTSLRLTRRELTAIWNNQAFRDFCRSHVVWYMEAFPHYVFPIRHPLRFPRW